MGPLSPGRTPSNVVFRSCWVVLAWAVGAGLSVETGFRCRTSKRGMGWVNAWTPNSGLRGSPVGIAAYALRANGLSPFCNTSAPDAVKSPILIRSRRDTWPCDHAFRISARFRRAFSASLTRALDAFPGRYIHVSPCRICSVYNGLKKQQSLRSEEHTSELQSQSNLVCRLLLEKKKKIT